KDGVEDELGHLVATVDGMIAGLSVHKDFRLDDWHDACFLAKRCIASQSLGVLTDRTTCRQYVGDRDHATPFGEPRTQLVVLSEAFTQAIEALGDRLIREACQRLGASIDLDTGNSAGIRNQLLPGRAVFRVLTQRLVIKNDTRHVVLHRFRTEEHLTVVATRISGGLHRDCVKALLDRAGAFVCSKDALARSHHPGCNVLKTFAHLLASPSMMSFLPSRGERQTE